MSSIPFVAVDTVEYELGRCLDIYVGTGAGHVLLWHGRGPNERDVLSGLAGAAAARGPTVLVPDWDSGADDGGRADLVASLAYARSHVRTHGHDDRGLVLAGWSRGAAVAAAVVISSHAVAGWCPAAMVGLAGGYARPDPLIGLAAYDHAERWPAHTPCLLVHGDADEVVPVERSRRFAARLRSVGAPARFDEISANHAGVVLARYDRARRRCVASDDDEVRSAGERSVAALVAAARPVVPGLPARGTMTAPDTPSHRTHGGRT